MDIASLDSCAAAVFAAAVAPLFEGAPRFLGRLAAARPFGSIEELFAQARTIAQAMPRDERLELIDAHPRLGAPPATVSAMSFREQGYDAARAEAQPADMTDATVADAAVARARIAGELDRLNAAYEARFGFRYCVFVAGRPREALLPGMVAALEADPTTELARAIDAVVDIAADRYAMLDHGYAMLGGDRDRAR
jgi:2-oxo-4-hydroxy-4-carboxy--5-ureidoimidazoline (OHCU) decarboxylase